jgi:pimeloyl-ACP methyl ester carboxylesterase
MDKLFKKLKINFKNEQFLIEYFLRKGEFKETLLYLHGGACSKEDFLCSIKIKDLNKYNIVAFDFLGCGNSPYSKNKSLNIDNLVEITKLVIEKLKLQNITLIGHSMGGLIAFLYIEKFNSIKSFINIEGNLAPESCVFSYKVAHSSYKNYENLFKKLKKDLKESKNEGFKMWGKTIEKYSSKKAFFNYCKQIVDYSYNGNLVEKYTNLKIPKLYIYGSENLKKYPYIKTLKEKNCDIAGISKSDHFPFYDNSKEFYSIISDFLIKNK